MKIFYFLCLFSSVALAQDNFAGISQAKSPYNRYVNSFENRRDKNFSLTANLIGVTHNLITTGISFGKYLNSNSLIVIELSSGFYDSNSYSLLDYSYSYHAKGQLVGLYWKNFAGNSFYTKLGVENNRVAYNYRSNISGFSSDVKYERSFEGTATSAAFTLGNQWQWRNFTLGCDWAGVSIPLSSSTSNDVHDGSTGQRERLENEKDHYVKNVSIRALNFYLGASF